jgi:hypothetical protein
MGQVMFVLQHLVVLPLALDEVPGVCSFELCLQ